MQNRVVFSSCQSKHFSIYISHQWISPIAAGKARSIERAFGMYLRKSSKQPSPPRKPAHGTKLQKVARRFSFKEVIVIGPWPIWVPRISKPVNRACWYYHINTATGQERSRHAPLRLPPTSPNVLRDNPEHWTTRNPYPRPPVRSFLRSCGRCSRGRDSGSVAT